MKHQIALFTFTLGNNESIGPDALKSLWARASGTSNVSVSRQPPSNPNRDRPTYTLYAPQTLDNLRDVELRLRKVLEESHLTASVVPLHL
ncbi:MAG: hypothetical protein V4704_05110 [Pseudomonadota bacterium]